MNKIIKNLRNINVGVQALYCLAILVEKLGYPTNALNMLKRAISSAPNNQKLYLRASRLYLKKGKVDKAAMCWERAVGQENLGVFLYWLNIFGKQSHTNYSYHSQWPRHREFWKSYNAQTNFTQDIEL